MLFELKAKCGNHIMDGKTYVAGDRIETSKDLTIKLGHKFKRIVQKEDFEPDQLQPNIPAKGIGNKSGQEDEIKSPSATDKSETKTSEHGVDITGEIDGAAEIGVKVYMGKANWCVVVDNEDGKILNDTKLRKKHVVEFLESIIEAEDDDDDEDEDE